jgi:mannose-6-phosphate isomerase-like protein (cupin superfamily)
MEFLDLLQSTFDNKAFRRVVATGEFCQLVLMSLKKGEGLEDEQLENDKIFLVLHGKAELTVTQGTGELKEGNCMLVMSETKYRLINTGEQEAKLIVVFSPAVLGEDTVDSTAVDAIMNEPT